MPAVIAFPVQATTVPPTFSPASREAVVALGYLAPSAAVIDMAETDDGGEYANIICAESGTLLYVVVPSRGGILLLGANNAFVRRFASLHEALEALRPVVTALGALSQARAALVAGSSPTPREGW